jgi:hypothetical protein
MHLQIRSVPALSPASLQAFLEVLAGERINIVAAGGSDIERGGEFAFAVAHDEEDRAIEALRRAGYDPRLVEVATCTMSDEPGQLLECIAAITESNAAAGRAIRDIAVGVPDEEGRIRVQVYSE